MDYGRNGTTPSSDVPRRVAEALERHRDRVLDRWSDAILSGPGPHYRQRPPEEVRRWLTTGIGAVTAALRTGTTAPLLEHGREVGAARERIGFAIDEVLDAMLRLKVAAAPEIDAELGADPAAHREARAAVDEALRVMVAAAGARFSAALREREQHVAVLEERQRLARDLHDSISQSIYSATMYAEAAHRLLGTGDTATASAHVAEARDAAVQALREMRLLIYELRPGALLELGLVGTLRDRLATVEQRAGVRASIVADEGAADLPPAVQEALYGIASEALNNTLKHAGASTVEVRITAAEGRAVLAVSDDGGGFDPGDGTSDEGLGLRGMRERVDALGGTLEIRSPSGRGTTVRAIVPTDPPGAA